jgi:hypothetical protein
MEGMDNSKYNLACNRDERGIEGDFGALSPKAIENRVKIFFIKAFFCRSGLSCLNY